MPLNVGMICAGPGAVTGVTRTSATASQTATTTKATAAATTACLPITGNHDR